MTHSTAATGAAATATASATSTATSRRSAARTFSAGLTIGTLRLLLVRLGLASKLNRDFSLENFLAGELSDSSVSLTWGGEIDEGVANGTVGARVLWDRNGLTGQDGLAGF